MDTNIGMMGPLLEAKGNLRDDFAMKGLFGLLIVFGSVGGGYVLPRTAGPLAALRAHYHRRRRQRLRARQSPPVLKAAMSGILAPSRARPTIKAGISICLLLRALY